VAEVDKEDAARLKRRKEEEAPNSIVRNVGVVHAAVQASLREQLEEALIDVEWKQGRQEVW